jgi:4-amino-4-deoxy-L-arabinose transferase-like glycosyltransferase
MPRFPIPHPVLHALVLAALALPYCIDLGGASLWDANEAFYAETPREMLESGNYLAPTFNYRVRAQKPPLTYWVVLASYGLFGVNEFAVRLPGALAALGTLLFVYGMARSLFSPSAALLAVSIIATAPRFFALSRKLPIDVLLIFWMTGTAFFLIRALQRDSGRAWLAAFAFAAFGFLTKGPVALAVPVLACIAWGLLTRRLHLGKMRLLWGSATLLGIALPWYILVYQAHGWTYIASYFLSDNLGRFAAETFGPSRGPHYYFPIYLAEFFPWSILSIGGFVQLWRSRERLRPLREVAYGFPLVWCAVIFVMFSLSKNKQEYYIAPLYPVMAVLISGVVDWGIRALRTREYSVNTWTWTFMTVSALLVGLSVFWLFIAPSMIPGVSPVLHYSPPAVLLVAAVTMAWNAARGRIAGSVAGLAVAFWLVFTLVPLLYLPAVEPLRPVKDLCTIIKSQSRSADEVGYFRATVPSMVYYLRRPIFEEFDADSMVRRFQSPGRVFCIMTEQDHNYFVGTRDQILYVLDRRPRLITRLRSLLDDRSWAEQELLLVSNQPALEPGTRGTRGDQ